MDTAALDKADLVSMITDSLSARIVDGDFAPGFKLNEVRLAETFSVSRAPIREALRRLESQGLVISIPRRGFFLRGISASEMDDLFELRMAVERAAGIKVARTAGPEEVARLEHQYHAVLAASQSGDYPSQIEEDFRFHRLVCELSGNARLLRVFDQISSEIRFGIVHLRGMYDDLETLAKSHAPLLSAIAENSPRTYAEVLALHLGEAQRHVRNALIKP